MNLTPCRFLRSRTIPNLKRHFRGLPVDLDWIDDTWAGDFVRQERKTWSELFLYSKEDMYLPIKYAEETVEAKKRAAAGDRKVVRARRWEKSNHVGHLRANPEEYAKTVHDFLYDVHFSKLK